MRSIVDVNHYSGCHEKKVILNPGLEVSITCDTLFCWPVASSKAPISLDAESLRFTSGPVGWWTLPKKVSSQTPLSDSVRSHMTGTLAKLIFRVLTYESHGTVSLIRIAGRTVDTGTGVGPTGVK